ncbi:MAG: hypothetical protein ACTHK0_17715 [Ginsengibacter sp.]
MKEKSNINDQPQKPFRPAKPILVGAITGLILIFLLLVFGAHQPNQEWGKYGKIRPFVVEPLAGALGGLFYYFMHYMGSNGAVNKTMAVVLGIAVFIMVLWLGVVLSDDTMWH